jgi:alanyl-tRNA synthetase
MRRAVRFGDRLGFKDLFFHEVVDRAVELFTPAYPELASARALLGKVVVNEEDAFRRTLQKGTERVAQLLSAGTAVSGEAVFELKATYGFPPDLTALMLREHGLSYDEASFKEAEDRHTKASSTDSFQQDAGADIWKSLRAAHGPTVFTGYDSHSTPGVKVLAIVKDGVSIPQLGHGEQGFVILDRSPFYGESGGQVGDMGHLKADTLIVDVDDTKKQAELHLHAVAVKEGTLKVGAVVDAVVDDEQLDRVRKNHSATHLLHAALRQVLGEHVVQKGSLVDADRLRFDFAHFEAMTRAQIEQVEDIVNDMVLENVAADVEHMHFDAAKQKGAMALFGEKYGDHVRVVAFPTITRASSVELCGGIHVRRTGDIGLIKVTSEGPLAAGVRRIEAVTGKGALEWVRKQSTVLTEVARNLKASVDDVPSRIEKMNENLKEAYAEIQKYKNKAQSAQASSASSQAVEINGIKLLALKAEGIDPKGLREYADKLRDQVGGGVVVVGVVDGEKVTLLVALTADVAKAGKLHAGKILGELAVVVGGKGGGKPDFAQGGGSKPEMLDAALSKAKSLVEAALA